MWQNGCCRQACRFNFRALLGIIRFEGRRILILQLRNGIHFRWRCLQTDKNIKESPVPFKFVGMEWLLWHRNFESSWAWLLNSNLEACLARRNGAHQHPILSCTHRTDHDLLATWIMLGVFRILNPLLRSSITNPGSLAFQFLSCEANYSSLLYWIHGGMCVL